MDEKEQEAILSDPLSRLNVDKSPRADAVSAAARVRRIIPRKSSLVGEKDMAYMVARTSDVASRLKIAIRMCDRCLAAATSVKMAVRSRADSKCIA